MLMYSYFFYLVFTGPEDFFSLLPVLVSCFLPVET